jgi:hypothetical protein
VSLRIQRWYAYAVFALRGVIRATSFDNLFEWKARVIVTLSQGLVVLAVFWTITAATGHSAWVPGPTSTFVLWSALGLLFYLANARVERRLLPRYQSNYLSLRKGDRIAATVGVLLFVVLSFASAMAAATFDRAHNLDVRSNQRLERP